MSARVLSSLLCPLLATVAGAGDQAGEHFEKKIRPLFAAHCVKCHGPAAEKGKLRLDQRARAFAGGESGKAIVPGRPNEGELLKAVRYEADGYRMPPTGKLPDDQIVLLEQWVRDGAYWPPEQGRGGDPPPSEGSDWVEVRRRQHWCWRPPLRRVVPDVRSAGWTSTPIDRFLLAKIEEKKLAPSNDADRYALLRRLHFVVTGLPPTAQEIGEFVNDSDPVAFDRTLDRLLSSPAFGERWARHWLDLVRYSETLGHEFDFDIPNAWRYRDYVIRALNADLPYDQFVLEQLAGDLLPNPRLDARGKTNESVIGPASLWFGEAKQAPVDVRAEQADHVDNQIDVFGKAFLGLTVACARCHDHKFDAITAKDYYSLYGFFKSTRYAQASTVPVRRWRDEIATRSRIEQEIQRLAAADWKTQLKALRQSELSFDPMAVLNDTRATPETRREVEGASNRVIGDASNGFASWRRSGPAALIGDAETGDPILGTRPSSPILRVQERTAFHSARWTKQFQGTFRSPTFLIDRPKLHLLAAGDGSRVNVVIENFNVIRDPIYGGLKVRLENPAPKWMTIDLSRWIGREAYVEFLDQVAADLGDPGKGEYPPHAWFSVEKVLLSNGPPPTRSTTMNRRRADPVRSDFDGGDRPAAAKTAFEELRGLAIDALEQWRSGDPMTRREARVINALIDARVFRSPKEGGSRLEALFKELGRLDAELPTYDPTPTAEDGDGRDEAVFIRGNPAKPGAPAPRGFLQALGGSKSLPGQPGSGRLWLARTLVEPNNPLVARAFVNRVWRHVFGRGLVESPDNLGALGEAPSHPELLDHLTTQFVKDGWSLKRLLRQLLTSRAFRTSSVALGRDLSSDPQDRLHARANVRRLDAEALRDAIVALGGRPNRRMYGPGVPVYLDEFAAGRGKPKGGPVDGEQRRTIYLSVRRNFPSAFLSAFDAPVPAGPMGKRTVSNVPAQALILLNDPFVVDSARRWARKLLEEEPSDADARLRRLYLTGFGRPPTASEIDSAKAFLSEQAALRGRPGADADLWSDLCHAIFNAKEFLFLQ